MSKISSDKTVVITRKKANEILINYQKPAIFWVKFVKRTNGEVRTMVCRRGVKKHLKGGNMPYDPLSKGLLPVFEMGFKRDQSYRVVNLGGVLEFTIDKVRYIVEE